MVKKNIFTTFILIYHERVLYKLFKSNSDPYTAMTKVAKYLCKKLRNSVTNHIIITTSDHERHIQYLALINASICQNQRELNYGVLNNHDQR